ncbi:hypothetical protein MIND_00013600 [Mycena indigotica]|uniref:Uncharacterized protein n=1 Tax=Mycena indigotica TaxID=2126181 RepID=A0A8H6TFV4_9AGAR|nr:uncharacterized protein MIND_00013600 [Mycena indigotica]KAF7314995.1 hypothetical protein MIND_00013600 [Mycena indigotica]
MICYGFSYLAQALNMELHMTPIDLLRDSCFKPSISLDEQSPSRGRYIRQRRSGNFDSKLLASNILSSTMSNWDASLKVLRNKAPAVAEPSIAAALDARIAAAEREFDASLVWLILYPDGTNLHLGTNGLQHYGVGPSRNIGHGAFKGFQHSLFFGPYTLRVTATSAHLYNPFGIAVYEGTGYAQPSIRGFWSMVF